MKKHSEPLLGVCPIGKFVFSHEDAIRQKKALFKQLDAWKVRYCDLEGVLPDGLVRDQKHVAPVVAHFKKKGIDALFVPHCNFGTEGAVGMIARLLGVPVLVWGPRDDAPLADGSRLRDSLCGLFASTGVLRKLKVPFTYIENCRVDEAPLKEGVRKFVRAAAVVKAMRGMRIGQIGSRIDFFWSTIINEQDLMERFNVQVLPVDMVEFLRGVKACAEKHKKRYAAELKRLKTWMAIGDKVPDRALMRALALRDELARLASDQDLDAIALQTFSSLQNELGPGTGLAESLAVGGSVPVSEETDLHGAISSVLLEAAAGTDEPSFFPEFTIRHPENDNAVLLWHAAAALSLRDPESRVKLAPPWILKGLPPSNLHFKLKDGPLTVCRFEKDDADYVLGIGQGHTVPGPHTQEFYAWMEVDDWPTWERKLMEGPYIHHVSASYTHCADALVEACKYIPGLHAQRFEKTC